MSSSDTLGASAEEFVRQELSGDASGHDWWHIARVRDLALRIAREEGADPLVVELAALLHDIADYKISGSSEAGPRIIDAWLRDQRADPRLRAQVTAIVAGMSFGGAGVEDVELTLEGCCVRDADRLDAMGAIGIARTFAYGGSRGRLIHDPSREPVTHASVAEYQRGDGSTIAHFYEKLLLLRDRMTTRTGRRIGRHRHDVMLAFLDEFHREWSGSDGLDETATD